jgi:hypothetical protein
MAGLDFLSHKLGRAKRMNSNVYLNKCWDGMNREDPPVLAWIRRSLQDVVISPPIPIAFLRITGKMI